MVYKKNVTYIQDLEDTNNIEHFNSKPANLPKPHQRAIRASRYNNPYDEMNKSRGQMNQMFRENFNNATQSNMSNARQSSMEHFSNNPFAGGTKSHRDSEILMSPRRTSKQEYFQNVEDNNDINCLDICNHIKDCPLCSQFYDNDKTIYIIIIVMLCILNLIFLKKILNL